MIFWLGKFFSIKPHLLLVKFDCRLIYHSVDRFNKKLGTYLIIHMLILMSMIITINMKGHYFLTNLTKNMFFRLIFIFQILECGGNLFDAVSLAVKAALFNTKLPSIVKSEVDGPEIYVEISDNPYEYRSFDIKDIPIMVRVYYIKQI